MNYTELSAAITEFLENDETTFVSNIPTFVRLAEKRVFVALKLPAQRRNVTGMMTADNRFLTLPSNTLKVLSLQFTNSGSVAVVDKKDPTFIREAYPDPTETGAPTYYAVYDEDSLLLGPTPDANYATELQYDGLPDSIVDVATTWVGNNLDRLLLYACLVEGYTFMKGDADVLATYEGAFREELEKAALKVQSGAYRQDEYRAGG